ncbi:hypothetical protein NEIG_00874 [Nematocida sp. ERTm5]|nr:hypothetical protein NEIG_00874 [Nematocida sp. ERTm5]
MEKENGLGDTPKERGTHFTAPFYHRVIDNFLPKDIFDNVVKEARSSEFFKKHTDLFHFYQTNELKNDVRFQPFLKFLRLGMNTDLKNINKNVENEEMDLFSSVYRAGDFLLPHDDCVSGRVLAFSFYLNDPTTEDTSTESILLKETEHSVEQKNGALVLYEPDGHTVAKRVKPIANRLVIFEVSGKSYHEVEIMTSGERLALTGWLRSNEYNPESILLDYRPFRYWVFNDKCSMEISKPDQTGLIDLGCGGVNYSTKQMESILSSLKWKPRLNCVYTSLDEPVEDLSSKITILPMEINLIKSEDIVDVLVGRIPEYGHMLLNDPFNTDSDALAIISLYNGPINIVDSAGNVACVITKPGCYIWPENGSLFIPPHSASGYIIAYRVNEICYIENLHNS